MYSYISKKTCFRVEFVAVKAHVLIRVNPSLSRSGCGEVSRALLPSTGEDTPPEALESDPTSLGGVGGGGGEKRIDGCGRGRK